MAMRAPSVRVDVGSFDDRVEGQGDGGLLPE